MKLVCTALALLFTGCAHVTFYKDEDLSHETGLKYFEAKPYLLVARKAKDQVETSVIYLPDKSKPQYAKYTSGLGSHEFTVNVANGILSSYGQKADSKIPELIQAMTGLLKEGVATAEKAGKFAAQGAPNLGALATEVDDLGTNMLEAVKANALPAAEKALSRVQNITQALTNTAVLLRRPAADPNDIVTRLKTSRDDLSQLLKPSADKPDPMTPVARYNAVLTTAINRIDVVIAALKGEPTPSLPFELYEVVQDGQGKPSLWKVQ